MSEDIVFHILDILPRDEVIVSENEDAIEVEYDSGNDADADEDDDFKRRSHNGNKKQASETRSELLIHLFGRTVNGINIRVDVEGFCPYFYIEAPNLSQNGLKTAVRQLGEYIQRYCQFARHVKLELEFREKFYAYTNHQNFPFIKLTVKSMRHFYGLRQLFLDKQNKSEIKAPIGTLWKSAPAVYESNLDPMLRFLHTQNIQPCGWVKIKDVSFDDIIADGSVEIRCKYTDVLPAVAPAAAAPFITVSWDIECFSSSGDFPLAKKTFKKVAKDLYVCAESGEHAVQLIEGAMVWGPNKDVQIIDGSPIAPIICKYNLPPDSRTVFKSGMYRQQVFTAIEKNLRQANPDREDAIEKLSTTLNTLLGSRFPIGGDPIIQIGAVVAINGSVTERHMFVYPSCDPIEGVIVHQAPTESKMMTKWFQWIEHLDPDILIGYNVFGFDEKYLWERAEELGIENDVSFQSFNRLSNHGGIMRCEESFLSSSALGDNFLYMWSVQGRLQIDLYHYVKRTMNLASYKLDDVAMGLMSGSLVGIADVPVAGTLELTLKGAIKDIRVGRALKLLDESEEPITEKLEVIAVAPGGKITVTWTSDDADEFTSIKADAEKWVIVKDDVSPAEIFKFHCGTSADRAKVAKYCIQDCDLVLELYKKLETFMNAMAMANVCSVPVRYIFTRGQGIKIESLIAKECLELNKCIVTMPSPNQRGASDASYEGAIVLDPIPAFYSRSPIGVGDFASLYPSTIISENISHDTLVWTKDFDDDGYLIRHVWGSAEYDGLEGVDYTDIKFDLLVPDPEDTRKTPRKIKVGNRICRYAQDSAGTMPIILTKLLAARKAKRLEAAKETDPLRIILLDTEQLAYKLTANSLYGQLGSGTFKMRLQDLAASTTAYGRLQIMFAKAVIERFYGPDSNNPRCSARSHFIGHDQRKVLCEANIMYGDSVTGNTSLFIKDGKTDPKTIRIDEINGAWTTHHDTKEAIDLSRTGFQVWTEKGWTSVKRIIRHRLHPDKKLYRILTHTGVVDVTEDHSLVLPDGKECRPSDVVVGTELLHNHTQHSALMTTNNTVTEDEAWLMGFFLADGSSDVYNCPSGIKASWAINKLDYGLLEEAQRRCPFETKILDTVESSGVFKLVPNGEKTKEIALKYRQLFYNNAREKKVPECILNAPNNIAEAFFEGFYNGDGDKDKNGYCRFDQKGKEVCSGLYLLARKLGYQVSINDRASKLDVFRLTMTRGDQRKNPQAIKVIRELPHPGEQYVYDLETENHHFAVGPGALVVHNTDSLFIEFNPRNPETGERLKGREAREAVIELTTEAGHLVTHALKPPHDFEFDKAFDQMLMFSKKRYAGKMYESNPDDFVYKYMGIALKRRDSAPIVKKIYGNAMKIILDESDVAKATKYVQDQALELVSGKTSLGLLTITKSLRAEYANPDRIAHKVLADRMFVRDPGTAPAAGDRIGYVFIKQAAGQVASKKQGDRIETPAYVRANPDCELDAAYYIQHQLAVPISQMFGLLLEMMPGYKKNMLPPHFDECDMGTQLKHRECVADKILFEPALQRSSTLEQKRVMRKMFNLTGEPSTVAAPKRRTANTIEAPVAAPKKVQKQSRMTSYMKNKEFIDAVKRMSADDSSSTGSRSSASPKSSSKTKKK
jgi:DNA polymerase elongation subunit (family B)